MRHVIVSKDVAGPAGTAAAGALVGIVQDANGQPTLMNRTTAAAAKLADSPVKFGVLKEAASVSLALLNETPWLKPSEIVAQGNFYPRAYVAALPQIFKKDCTGAGTEGKAATIKIIIEDNHSMFNSYSFEFKAGSGVVATAQAAIDAIQARLDKGACPEIASVVLAATDEVHITMAAGIRATYIFDAQDSGIVLAEDSSQAFVFGHGTYDEVVKKEKEQLGRDVGNYDRYTALPAEEVLNAEVGKTYNSYSFTAKNNAEGQIRGVDNMRSYQLYIPFGGTYLDGEATSEHGGTEEEFPAIMIALGVTAYTELQA